MKLYFSPQVCSLVPHIVLRQLDVPFDLERVDFKTKLTSTGTPLASITPKNYVPVLQLDDGSLLTELAVIIHHLADTHPHAKLAPPRRTMVRVHFDELVHFISTELHKAFAPFTLLPNSSEETKAFAKHRLGERAEVLRTQLGTRDFIFGDTFTIADAYAFWALRAYSFLTKAPLEGTLKEYLARMTAWPSVKSAVDFEKRS